MKHRKKIFFLMTMLVAMLLAAPATKAEVTSVSGEELAQYASSEEFLGIPYVWGGTTTAGFDCSGFVQYIYNHYGIALSRTTYTQKEEGETVTLSDLLPGDLVFFLNYGHVGIYIGDNKIVHASSSKGVTISSLENGSYFYSNYCGATRILN